MHTVKVNLAWLVGYMLGAFTVFILAEAMNRDTHSWTVAAVAILFGIVTGKSTERWYVRRTGLRR